jgi:hypothetical protein
MAAKSKDRWKIFNILNSQTNTLVSDGISLDTAMTQAKTYVDKMILDSKELAEKMVEETVSPAPSP